jgi:heat shock protein HspQ
MGDVLPFRTARARFHVGELVRHRLFDYRGVIFDVDPQFSGSEAWYTQMARSRPPKDKPWYHVLVHGASHQTYVAERNLEPDPAPAPIAHPLVGQLLGAFDGQAYRSRGGRN